MRPCARVGCCVTGLNLDVKRVSNNRRSHLLGHVCAEVAEPRFLGEDSGV